MPVSIDRSRLKAAQQEHLLTYWDQLDETGRQRLAQQIEALDLELLARLYRDELPGPDWRELSARAEPPPAYRVDGSGGPVNAKQAAEAGQQALRAGKLGLILVAGGQGTRLGYPHPKGMLPIGPVSRRSLFQILIDRLRAVQRRYGVRIPLYLMTSPATHEETLAYFDAENRCGLAAEDLKIFCQGVMPAVAADSGKILMEAPDQLCLSPDGHGGMLAALQRSGGLADAAARGIEQLFYAQIDNPLAQLCDPTLIGYHLLSQSELTTQVVAKAHALERVGNVVLLDGKVRIIEYSDLPDEVAQRTTPHGDLRLWAGNIAVHVFDRRFLERVANRADALPFHRARKKTPYLDEQGRLVEPAVPNAIKFERFIFDLLPEAENAIAVEARKADAFAPVKNAPGEASDTAELAQQAMMQQHRAWLTAAGIQVPEQIPLEIHPLWALDAEEVAEKVSASFRISQATYLR